MSRASRFGCRTRECWGVAVIALVFLTVHLPFLAASLADIDGVNLALGVRSFDPAQHRPHPPGYPIFIALGKLSSLVLGEAQALAIWGVLLGAAAAFAFWRFFAALGRFDGEGGGGSARAAPIVSPAVAASALTLFAPLVWFSAARPMTDIAGLAAAALAQAVLATALVRQNARPATLAADDDRARAVQSGRLILAGAFLSALAIGVRSQAVWLTLPLLVFVIVDRAGRGAAGALLGSVVWFTVGTLVWAVPLLVASGGPLAYWAAFQGQAGEDWRDAAILATHPGLRALASSLVDTFIRPWDSYVLGGVMIALAMGGALVLARRGRKALVALLVIAVPYGAFHLLFQETPHTRYAIPLVPIVAYLAVRALAAFGRWALPLGTAAIVVVSLATVQPQLVAFARAGSPADELRAALDARIAAGLSEPRPVLRLPQALGIAWRAEPVDLPQLTTLRARQWTVLVDHWRGGSLAPVWYVAEPEASGLDNRHDLVGFDPAAERLLGRYRWPFDPINLLGGVRPSELDWYEIEPPGWMFVDPSSLTPRLAGLSSPDANRLTGEGLRILVRRRHDPVNVLVGGRNLGKADDPPVRFTLLVDGAERESWTVTPSPGFFLRTWEWVSGVEDGPGAFAELRLTAEVADGRGRNARAAIEQFDLQPVGTPVLGFGDGWHEQEYDPERGTLWRWSGERATLRILGATGDVVLHVTGEAPSRYFSVPSHVVVSAGTRTLFETDAAADFDWSIPVPASVLSDAGGRLVLRTSQTFRPTDRGRSPDARALGLRCFTVSIRPASGPDTAASSRTGDPSDGGRSPLPTGRPTGRH